MLTNPLESCHCKTTRRTHFAEMSSFMMCSETPWEGRVADNTCHRESAGILTSGTGLAKYFSAYAAPTGCCCRLGTRGSPPCQNFPRSIELCVKQHALLQHENWLHSTWRPCSASNLQHLSSCCFPTSPSWAPVSHRTSPGSRETNVQEAPRKKGLRSVGFATVMNSLEFSQVSPHVGRPFFAALSSIPFGTLASPVSKFATSCTSRA